VSGRHWNSTYAFRTFRAKHTSLSQLYWMSQLGAEAVARASAGQPPDGFVADAVGASFPRNMFPETCAEFLDRLEERAGVGRLHLLVIASANLESYLQDAARLYAGALGHGGRAFRLDAVGEALAAPVLRSSAMPEMLKYLERLLGLSFGAHLERWREGYKLRCAAAHTGGVVTTRTRRELPQLKLVVGERITLRWEELKGLLGAADDMATSIDRTIATPALRALEARWILEELKDDGALPPRARVWRALAEGYRITLPKPNRATVEAEVYER
jgi:hypothetical protein